jgi:DnaJ like chaperone protein
MKFGKWIGAGLGWTIGGPIGALLGFAFGSFIDASNLQRFESSDASTTKGDFIVSLLVLIAAIMKADRKVLQSELAFVKNYLARTFNQKDAAQLLIMLRDILKQDIPIKDVTRQIRSSMDYSSRLQLLHLIYGIALADGAIGQAEEIVIAQIAGDLGISSQDTDSIRNMYMPSTGWAYKVLEVDSNASNDEIKKTYRNLALKNHPDRVAYLGEEIRQKAQEKFQKINEAYETIKKERGLP